MPNGTIFVTILRDPIYQFESMFIYCSFDKIWNITFDSFGDQSLKIPENIFLKRWFGMIGINQMMFNLDLT
jgi:hypothetical protein